MTWEFVNASSPGSAGLTFGATGARLSQANGSLVLDSEADFEGTGILAPNFTAEGGSLQLLGNRTNRFPQGTFDSASGWSYADSGDATNASWDPASAEGWLSHASSAASLTLFDGLDAVSGAWLGLDSGYPSYADPRDSSDPDRKEGTGMMELVISLDSGSSWAGASRTVAGEDWSSSDRFVFWVRAPAIAWEGLEVSLWLQNLSTSAVGAPIALTPGWQEVVVNLTALPVSRETIVGVQIRFSVRSPLNTPLTLYLDALRRTTAKVSSEWATIEGTFEKTFASSASPWSARFDVDWHATSRDNVSAAVFRVNVTGPSGDYEETFPVPEVGAARRLTRDLSAVLAAAGSYAVRLALLVSLDTVYASSADLGVDNVTILIPDLRNATFLSAPMPAALPVSWESARWLGAIPPDTAASVSVRFGNSTDTGDGTWTDFRPASRGSASAAGPATGRYAQARVVLETTNTSLSPQVDVLEVGYSRYVGTGTVATTTVTPGSSLLGWRRFNATLDVPPGTYAALDLLDGVTSRPVEPGENLSYLSASTLQVRATLGTVNGSVSPTLVRLSVVYEFLGPLSRIDLAPERTSSPELTLLVGESVTFMAQGFDAYGHPVAASFLSWSTTDPGGRVQNGVYTAGVPGTWFVNATASGGVVGSIVVMVLPRPTGALPLEWGLAIVLAAVGAGYAAYGYASRRLFATDDVFVVARDGRLMMHNTRRLRADRDEDVFAGMLAAIGSFVRDSFREENGDLRRFEFAGKTVLVERGRHVFVAAIHSGRVPRWAARDLRAFVADLEARFGPSFAAWNGSPEDLQGLQEFTALFVSRVRYRRSGSRKPAA